MVPDKLSSQYTLAMFRYAFATFVFRLLALPLVLSSGCFDLYSGSEQLRQAGIGIGKLALVRGHGH